MSIARFFFALWNTDMNIVFIWHLSKRYAVGGGDDDDDDLVMRWNYVNCTIKSNEPLKQ